MLPASKKCIFRSIMKFAASLSRIISPPDQTHTEIGTGLCANAYNKGTN